MPSVLNNLECGTACAPNSSCRALLMLGSSLQQFVCHTIHRQVQALDGAQIQEEAHLLNDFGALSAFAAPWGTSNHDLGARCHRHLRDKPAKNVILPLMTNSLHISWFRAAKAHLSPASSLVHAQVCALLRNCMYGTSVTANEHRDAHGYQLDVRRWTSSISAALLRTARIHGQHGNRAPC